MSVYNLVLFSSTGEQINFLDDFTSLEYARSLNNLGKATITLPTGYLSSQFQRDQRIQIWRGATGYSPGLECQTFWLIRKITRTLTNTGYTTELVCHDLMDILNRRIVDYTRDTNYADKLIINGNDDYEDNLIKAYVRENLGSLAVDTDRNLSTYLTIDVNTGQSANQYAEKQASYRSVLSTCQELAQLSTENDVALYFDIEADAEQAMTFRTYINQRRNDLTVENSISPVIFSDEFGNLTDVNLIRDYTQEITTVTVGGDGNGAGRAIEVVEDATRIAQSPFNRIESFHDARDWEEPTLLQKEGQWRLQKGKPKLILSAKAIDLPQTSYGVHYGYGDRVTAIADGTQFSCLIDAVSVKVANGREELDIRLKGEVAL